MNKIYWLENYGHVNLNDVVWIGDLLDMNCGDSYFQFRCSHIDKIESMSKSRKVILTIHYDFLEAWKEYHANT